MREFLLMVHSVWFHKSAAAEQDAQVTPRSHMPCAYPDNNGTGALIYQIRHDPTSWAAQKSLPVISSYLWNVQSELRFSNLIWLPKGL